MSTLKVTTLSGKSNNAVYTNGAGNVATFIFPMGVCIDSQNNIFTFDDFVNVIRKILPDGTTSQFCGDGTFISPSFKAGFVDGASNVALFSDITAIAIDSHDNLYVMDNSRLRKITPQGNVSTITSNQSEFKFARGLCVDASGNIYVSDTDNNRIRKVTPSGVITTIATGFKHPKGIVLDASGNLYVSDSDNAMVKKINTANVVSTYASGFGSPSGLCFDAQGNLYVSDELNSIIYKVTPSSSVTNYAGSGYVNFRDGLVGTTRFSASFNAPEGICIDPQGNIYVADSNSQRIRKIGF